MKFKNYILFFAIFVPLSMAGQDTVRVRRIQKLMRNTHYGPGLTLQKNFNPSAFNVAGSYFWARDYKKVSITLEDAVGYSFTNKTFYNSLNADLDFGFGVIPGVSLNTYTDFKSSKFYFAPTIGVGSYAIKLFYGYNMSLDNNSNFQAIGIVLRPQILLNAWINADSGLSQFDVRKKRKKRKRVE